MRRPGYGCGYASTATKQNVTLVALADALRDRLDDCYKALMSDDISDWSGATGNLKEQDSCA
ncbi:MAG: hypothetical protein U5K54_18800 [Cytophagales bacterium]|nr:hypothetical protein [Cytophagales bacterium]